VLRTPGSETALLEGLLPALSPLLFQIKAIGQTELNASNPEEVLQLAAQRRKKKFLQAMAKLYF